mgnify:CR=1 FL=1
MTFGANGVVPAVLGGVNGQYPFVGGTAMIALIKFPVVRFVVRMPVMLAQTGCLIWNDVGGDPGFGDSILPLFGPLTSIC